MNLPRLLRVGAVQALLLVPLVAQSAPTVFRITESAAPGDIIGVQGDGFGTNPQVWFQRVVGTEPSLSPQTRLTVLNANESPGFVSARIPAGQTPGLYAIWVSDGSNFSAPTFVNQARAWGTNDLCGLEVDSGRVFRLFGRNLSVAGATPAVYFVQGGTSLAATVTPANSDAYMLEVTAPTGLTPGVAYDIHIRNGHGADYGETTLPYSLTARLSTTDPFGLGVPWGADFPFAANVYNVTNDPRLTLHAIGNGTTDDAPAIQHAINVANAAGGGVLYFPTGVYKILGPASTNAASIGLKSNVVFKGDGADESILRITETSQYGFGMRGPASQLGFVDIGVENTTTGASWGVKIDNNASRIFVLRSRFEADAGKVLAIGPCSRILIKDSTFITGPGGEQLYLRNNRDLVFRNNIVNWYYTRVRVGQESIRTLLEDNVLTRTAILNGQTTESGGFDISMCDSMVVLNNAIGRDGDGALRVNNDGETIMAQGEYNTYRDVGMTTSATATTLTDSSKNWIYDRAVPDISSGHRYHVSIVAGPGTGQNRLVASNTATTLTVSPAWDVIPTSESRYVVSHQVQRVLVKDNTLTENPQGIMFYVHSMKDVAVVNNVLTDNGAVWLRMRDRNSATPPIYDICMDTLISGNSTTNTLNWYNSVGSKARMYVEVNNVSTPTAGTHIFGLEFRNNSITAPLPNQNTGLAGEGFGVLALMDNGTPIADSSLVQTLGVILQGNAMTNTTDGVHLTTGAHDTIIWNAILSNVVSLVLDSKITTAAAASVATAFGEMTGWWSFEGSNSDDSSGNENNAIQIDNPSFSTDAPTTRSLSLNGTGYLEVPEAKVITLINEMTISLWVKGSTTGQTGYARLLSKKDLSTTDPGWSIQRNGSGDGFALRLDTSAGGNQLKATIPGVLDDQWHHIAFTVGGGKVKSYKNGVLIATHSYNHGAGLLPNGLPLLIGASHAGGYRFKGKIDEVRLFANALSDAQIVQLYQNP